MSGPGPLAPQGVYYAERAGSPGTCIVTVGFEDATGLGLAVACGTPGTLGSVEIAARGLVNGSMLGLIEDQLLMDAHERGLVLATMPDWCASARWWAIGQDVPAGPLALDPDDPGDTLFNADAKRWRELLADPAWAAQSWQSSPVRFLVVARPGSPPAVILARVSIATAVDWGERAADFATRAPWLAELDVSLVATAHPESWGIDKRRDLGPMPSTRAHRLVLDDLLALGGRDARSLPFGERIEILTGLEQAAIRAGTARTDVAVARVEHDRANLVLARSATRGVTLRDLRAAGETPGSWLLAPRWLMDIR